jgi:murein DD-endopeptidase MepM/ murein hydrolase activator NlpD
MRLDKKTFTFLLVSNRKGTTRKITISAAWMKAALVGFALSIVILASCVVDYVGLLSQAMELRRTRAENQVLKEQFQVVEGKLNSLENGLERVKSWVVKLKNITNIDDENRELKLAIGPLPREGAIEPVAERGPSSELGAEDAVFYGRAPVDESHGEVTVEGQRDYASLAVRIDGAVSETLIREQGVLELYNSLSERQNLLSATPSIKPARGWFTSKFGYRISPFTGRPVMHNGLDIAASPGAPVFSPADGIVSYAGYDPGYGKLVSIDHGYGVITRYGHLSQISVEVGQRIKRRELIAAVGNTGRSTGPHLHYEVRVNNIPVDPINYVLDE